MTDSGLRLLLGAILLLHGLGHFGALLVLVLLRFRPAANTGAWTVARSWLLPTATAEAAGVTAAACWCVALVGFLLTAAAFWGIVLPTDSWRALGVASALVSTLGIVLFFGTWPRFNTLAALGVNIAVLLAVLVLRWPPVSLFG